MAKVLQLRVSTSTGQSIQPDKAGTVSLKPNESIILNSASFGEQQPDGAIKWIAELPCGQEHAAAGRFIPWQNPAISFVAFVLKNLLPKNLGTKPFQDGEGTPASALYYLIKQRETEDMQPTWLQSLFGIGVGSNQLERLYFAAKHNGAQETFSVKLLANEWTRIRFEVLSGTRVLPASCYANLAELIPQSFRRRARRDKGRLLDVLVYDWEQADYYPIRQARAVWYRSALKIVITPERSGHFYLAWINSRGENHSLHPFADWKWAPPAKDTRLERRLVLPLPVDENSPQAYYIDTPRGLETVFLLQRDSALSAEEIRKMRSEITKLGETLPKEPPDALCERHWPAESKPAPVDTPRLIQGLAPESSAALSFLEELIARVKPFSVRIAALGIPNEGDRSA